MICCPLTSYDGSGDDQVVVDTVVAAHTCCECDGVFFCNYERARFYKCNCDCDHCLDSEHHICKDDKCTETSVFFTCETCLEIRDHFACNGFYYGQLWEDLCQNFFPTMAAGGPCLHGLSPTAKDALFDAYLENLEDTPREWTEHWEVAKDECANTEEFTAWLEDYGTFERSAPPAESLEHD